jgi:hypothetical protein
MRGTFVVASALLVVALMVAMWGSTIIAHPPTSSKAEASNSIDVMQMMKRAKGLPEQSFDAH